MIMSHADIVREYKAAKTPMKQIGILADQNLCKKKEIVEILLKEGCEVPKFYTKAKEKKEDPAQEAADINVGTKEQAPDVADINVGEIGSEPVAGDTNVLTKKLEQAPVQIAVSGEKESVMDKANTGNKICELVKGAQEIVADIQIERMAIEKTCEALRNLCAVYECKMSEEGRNAIVFAIASLTDAISNTIASMHDSTSELDVIHDEIDDIAGDGGGQQIKVG